MNCQHITTPEPTWDLASIQGSIREHWRRIPQALEKVWDLPAIKAGLGADTDAPVLLPAQYTARGTPLNHFLIGGLATVITVVRTIVGIEGREPLVYISMRDAPECCPACFLARSSLRLAALRRLLWPWLQHPAHKGLFDRMPHTPHLGLSSPCSHKLFFRDWGVLPVIDEATLEHLADQIGDV